MSSEMTKQIIDEDKNALIYNIYSLCFPKPIPTINKKRMISGFNFDVSHQASSSYFSKKNKPVENNYKTIQEKFSKKNKINYNQINYKTEPKKEKAKESGFVTGLQEFAKQNHRKPSPAKHTSKFSRKVKNEIRSKHQAHEYVHKSLFPSSNMGFQSNILIVFR
jgi:hypothetical protein